MPLRAAASAVTWAANGVDLREPLNPAEPADSQTMTFPSRSVSDTIVLLNEVLMCAWPMATFLRTRRRVRPRAAALRGGAISSRLASSEMRVSRLSFGLLPASDGLLRALPRARVRLRALAVDGQTATVAHAPVAAD